MSVDAAVLIPFLVFIALSALMAHALMAGRVGGTAARGRAEAAAERALDLALAHNSQLFATRARATFEQLFTPTSATSPGQPAAANGVPRAVADVRRNRA